MTQEKALAILKSGQNVFLTGSAGAGKTYVLNQYIQYLKEHKVPVAVTASTGIAATHMNGMTIHAWSGIGIRDHITLKHLQTLKTKKYMKDKMAKVAVLILDEISMLHLNQLNMVDEVLQFFKGNNYSFGGIQVVFSGDFFQLPPIGNPTETSREKFCFMSKSWVRAGLQVCYLTQQFRQTNNDLNLVLNQIRWDEVDDFTENLLQEKVQESTYSDEEIFPQLYTHNLDVDRINQYKLQEIDEEPKKFKASTKGNKILVETMLNSILAPEELFLKIGAEVMFVRNNWDEGYFNGTLGQVKEFTENGFPLVETKDGRWIEAKPENWLVADETGKTLASITQIPLRLAWAITVHKSQGMTLDQATIDLRKTFEKGQGYVALSRLRDFKGLRLKGVNPMVLQLDDLARKADVRFRELSIISEDKFDIAELEKDFDSFVVRSGGTLDKREIKKQKEVIQAKNSRTKKLPNYLKAKELLDLGNSPKEISEQMGFQISTVHGYFSKIKEEFPDYTFESLQIDPKIQVQVQNALQNITFEDGVKMKPIFEFLEEKITYDQIRLALLKI